MRIHHPCFNLWISCFLSIGLDDFLRKVKMGGVQLFRDQMMLVHLVSSTFKSLIIYQVKYHLIPLKKAKMFICKPPTLLMFKQLWLRQLKLTKSIFNNLFELSLKNKLYEWLLKKLIEGCKTPRHDDQGQGVSIYALS